MLKCFSLDLKATICKTRWSKFQKAPRVVFSGISAHTCSAQHCQHFASDIQPECHWLRYFKYNGRHHNWYHESFRSCSHRLILISGLICGTLIISRDRLVVSAAEKELNIREKRIIALLQACKHNNLEAIRRLIKDGVSTIQPRIRR